MVLTMTPMVLTMTPMVLTMTPMVLTMTHSGLVLSSKDSGLVIRQVLGGTPAAEAGLKEGGQIVSVNGSAVTAQDLPSIRTLLRGAPGTTVRVQLADGSIYEVTLRQYL